VKIPDDVLAVLTDPRTEIEGSQVRIPWQLDRALYEKVDKLLREAGGRWDGRKKVRAHVWPHKVDEFMRHAVLAGEFTSPRDLGWFPTPAAVVDQLLDLAGVSEKYPGLTLLEPSAGTGAIAGPAAARGAVVDAVEVDERRAAVLADRVPARRVITGDFLADVDPLDYEQGFRRVVMNPPFRDALAHVNHAFGFLADDAILVSVLPDGVRWRTDRAHTEFRRLVDAAGGEFIPLRADAFEESGVRVVHTVIAVVPVCPGDRAVPNHTWQLTRPRQLGLFA
jgi:predicted RNA methylase